MKELLHIIRKMPAQERQQFERGCQMKISSMKRYLYDKKKKYGHLNPEVCSRVEIYTKGVVRREMLRPNDWWIIWPELVKADIRECMYE